MAATGEVAGFSFRAGAGVAAGPSALAGGGVAAGLSLFAGEDLGVRLVGVGLSLRVGATGAVFGGIFTVAPGFLGSTIFLAIAISRFWVPAMGWQGPGPQWPLRWPSQGKG